MFFGGKGGVGKTTRAAAHAFDRASRRPSHPILLISTDPAHSLGDVLGRKLSAKPRQVTRSLHAAELDAPRAFARWLTANRRALTDVLQRGTILDRADIDALLDLSMPGVDELVGLLEIRSLAAQRYGEVIVDTAPTGHTLRLLAAPGAVAAAAEILDTLQEDDRAIRRQFARVVREEEADRFIDWLGQQAKETAALLRDRRRTAFRWITLPEPMAIAETGDGIAALESAGIRVAGIIVNRVLPKGPKCPLCDPRRAAESEAIRSLRNGIGKGRRILIVPDNTKVAKDRKDTKAAARGGDVGSGGLGRAVDAAGGARLIFVGGKGGVGKTTVAAALALRIAGARPDRSVLLLSTDPAHSVADVLDSPLGDDERTVRGGPPNLVARELDAARALAVKRQAFEDEIATPLVDLAPPGVDELFGMLSILDARAAHDVIVVDTAPTGHALRLLEMPAVAREWVQALLRVLLKYKTLVRPGRIAQELVDASRAIRELQEMLRDASQTRFLVVTRAEPAARAETTRLVRRLRALRLTVPAVIVNARTLEPRRCPHCRAVARAEARETAALARFVRGGRRRDCAIIQTPLAAPPPRGAAALDRWAREP